MKIKNTIIILLFFFIFIAYLFPEQHVNLILYDIAANIGNYKNKKVTMKLKLKNLDSTFDKIIFYDRKNVDIVFDTAVLKKEEEFRKQALNLHQGMEYYVVFTVKELTAGNNVTGDLISFTPVILSKLPD